MAILLALICLVSVQADDDDDTLEATNVLLFLFFGLGIGILVMQALSYCGDPVPHTVVVFFMGMFFSLADSHHGKPCCCLALDPRRPLPPLLRPAPCADR